MDKIENLIRMPAPPTRDKPASTAPSDFDPLGFETRGDPALERMLAAASSMCAEIDAESPQRWLSLLGPSGCGKTHLSRAVGAFAAKRRSYRGVRGTMQYRDCIFRDCHELAKKARAGDWNEIDFVANAWFAVLDDIGAARDPTGYLSDIYLRILNRRLGRWTVITSNLYAEDIAEKVDARIASRLFRNGGVVIETTAKDWAMR